MTGGYQPHGKAEKHDDVRALLAQGELCYDVRCR